MKIDTREILLGGIKPAQLRNKQRLSTIQL